VKLVRIIVAIILTTAPASAQWRDASGEPKPVVPLLTVLHDRAMRFDSVTRAFVGRLADGRRVSYRALDEYLPAGKRRYFKDAKEKLLVLVSVERTVTKTVLVPDIRTETRYVDRIVEKPIPIPVEEKVFIDRPVYVDRTVVKTIDRPVTQYVDRPVLPPRTAIAAAMIVVGIALLAGIPLGAFIERRNKVHRFTLDDLQDLTSRARRMADEHVRTIRDMRNRAATARTETERKKPNGTVL
jgi:hypothetical protein